jgi:dihydroxyacetone kinase
MGYGNYAGDGDHGVTTALAAQAVRQKLDENPDAAGADLLVKVAIGIGSVGGVIGPAYESGVLRVAGVVRTLAPGGGSLTVGQLRVCAEAAAVAARSGAQSTAGMIATLGRASQLGERSPGSADPGATSFAIIAEALVGLGERVSALAPTPRRVGA